MSKYAYVFCAFFFYIWKLTYLYAYLYKHVPTYLHTYIHKQVSV
ncbi:hypothetical protein CCAN12_160005 [Capnocytophaga canimorsus]|uniref:Uncharacterized protein n=1 Tax=Capnocytophaga canimorsus TaxID=28188 RepID=A0A0B7H2L6_9FLAO|nr:hypothetical protein CCAN12_160005 [Capnocytophaga canimorsus]